MKTVLVIDDLQAELDLIGEYLRAGGYSVITAQNGEEGFEKALNQTPDVIITDLVMPEMTGLELCRKLKKTPATAEIPIIACTTRGRGVDEMWAKKQGVANYLVKPCTQADLVGAVKAVIG
ncbi:MAG: response regulator [Chloroflexaceae bacterium]|nr:response regulator [Chloroflexaceae bacterium]